MISFPFSPTQRKLVVDSLFLFGNACNRPHIYLTLGNQIEAGTSKFKKRDLENTNRALAYLLKSATRFGYSNDEIFQIEELIVRTDYLAKTTT